MNKPNLGSTYPVGHPSGRVWEPPVSIEQARARVVHEMRHLETNCRDGIDVGYAIRCLDEVSADFREIVVGS